MRKFELSNKLGILLLSLALLSGCGSAAAGQTGAAGSGGTAAAEGTAAETEFTNAHAADLVSFEAEDTAAEWSADGSTAIRLNGTSAEISGGSGAVFRDGAVTITAAGTYVLSGQLSDGQVVVDVQDKGKVRLVLNGVDIHDSDSAPIYVKQAGKAIITLADGSENVITDGEKYVYPDASTDEPNAALFSKADLTINGTGKLTVTGNYNNGITGKDDLKIAGGILDVKAADDGIMGRDAVAVQDGSITVKAGGDGIKSTNDEDAAKGFVAIAGGAFKVEAGSDGIQAETALVVDGGTFDLVTGGGNANGEVKTPEQGPGGPWGKTAASAEGGAAAEGGSGGGTDTAATAGTGTAAGGAAGTAEETESASAKGLKAGTDISVNGGSFTIDSADDAVHGNGNVGVGGGELQIATGDDGIHADALVFISGGKVEIEKSYEGVEGANITVAGGEVRVKASDDGVNVAGGSDDSSADGRPEQDSFSKTGSGNNLLTIRGGYLAVDADGDGLDSNGSIAMSGGTVVVHGPTSGGNGALDYDGGFEITGGMLVAAGSSGMAQAPSDTSSQYSIAMNFPQAQQAGTPVRLEDGDGKTILSFTPTKNYQTVVISTPEMKKGAYTLYTGGTKAGTETDGLLTGGTASGGTKVVAFDIVDSTTTWLNESGVTAGNTAGRGPGGGGGGRGMRPDGARPGGAAPPEGGTPPENDTPTEGSVPPEGGVIPGGGGTTSAPGGTGTETEQ
ncbi:hypothetical protein J25TS5_55440 [Paenibacillus faecis]|uniref:carbohydrate-binding domain-containing protein n=1 Tax=Paenibacillus faecis TaxID=862114 RepID=UPI001B2959EF|nr:carbohydrate-binding domain-containing protein [Paenibacillus faecis]GIO88612.1 hypothetical protein J25TS5_55440 [Paenibacillus faecis]